MGVELAPSPSRPKGRDREGARPRLSRPLAWVSKATLGARVQAPVGPGSVAAAVRPTRAASTSTDRSTGLTSTPLLVPLPGPKCRFCWPAQAKPHTSGVVPLPVPHIYGPHIYGPHICGRTHSNTHTHIHIHTHIHTLIHIHIHIQRVLSAAGPIARSEVSFLLACTSKTTHNGSDPKARTNLPAPAPRPAAPAPYRLRQTGVNLRAIGRI